MKTMGSSKVSNFSDLIQRVTASCLLHPLAGVSRPDDISDEEEEEDYNDTEAVEEYEDFKIHTTWETTENINGEEPPRVMELEMLMGQVFDAVSSMKRAYVSLQEAHCPWDPNKMRVSDVAVVAELRRLGLLRERFRRSVGGRGGKRAVLGAATLREVVAPYEAAVEELKREVKAQKAEVEVLREKLKTATSLGGSKSKGKSKRRVSCTTQG